MAEPVGTTLGALGVLGLLSVCIDSFNFIEDGRSVGKAFALLRGEFANLRFRLLVWSRACKFFDEGGYDARLNHPELRPQIFAQLNAICLLFMDAKKVIGRYDIPASSTQLSTPGSSVGFVAEGLHDFLKRIKDTKHRAGFRGAFLWALKDKRAFQDLLERLEKCISALELVTANLDLFAEPQVRRAIEIEIETLSDVEVLSHMVAASSSSHSGSVISGAASQRILSLRRHPTSHEHSATSSDSQTFYTAHTLQGVDRMEPIGEESTFSHLDDDEQALRKVLQAFSRENSTTYLLLLINWLNARPRVSLETSAFVEKAGVALNAPTSYHRGSPPISPKSRDSAEGSGPEAYKLAVQPIFEHINTLSNALQQVSLAVQEIFWDLKGKLRNKLEHGESIKEVIDTLQATYSKLPPIVLAAGDDLLGKLPAIGVLRESLSAPSDIYEAFGTAEFLRHGHLDRDPEVLQRIIEPSLSVLSGYVEPEELDNLLKDYPSAWNVGDDILIGNLTFRLAATACFWPLIRHLESQANNQAKFRRIKEGGNDGTHGRLDEREWGRRLLDFKRKDRKVWTNAKPGSLELRLRLEVYAMADSPSMPSLRILRGHSNAPVEAIITFEAPPQSFYATGIFQLHIAYPHSYPNKPMEIRFLTKVYHPNIDRTGKICLNLLETRQRSLLNTRTAVMAIYVILSDPPIDDPLVPEIAAMYIHDREEYKRCAQLYTKRYATLEAAVERLAQYETQEEER